MAGPEGSSGPGSPQYRAILQQVPKAPMWIASATEEVRGKPTPMASALAGAIGGVFAVTMSYPFDLIKTRSHFEVAKGGKDKVSMVKVAKNIWGEGYAKGGASRGFFGFYRGLDQLAPEAAFKTMLRFFIFTDIKNRLCTAMGKEKPDFIVNIIGGATAGAVETTLVVQPFERGKTLKADFQSPSKVYGELYRSKGLGAAVRSIYTGYLPCLGRQVGNQATAFTVFYGAKDWYLARNPDKKDMNTQERMFFGFLSGAAACCVTMPMDVAKSIAQKQTGAELGTLAIMRNVLAEKGVLGLYAGLSPRIGRVGLDRAFGFLAVEYIIEKLVKMDRFRADE